MSVSVMFAWAVTVAIAAAIWIAMICGLTLEALWGAVVVVWNGVAFLLQTWVPQTLLAAWAAFQLQEISLENGRKRESLQSAYERKVEATKLLYSLIEKRVYATRRYLDVIETESTSINEEREKYVGVVTEWNETVKIAQVTILLEFRGDIGLSLDNYFFPKFLAIDGLLRKQRIRVQGGSPTSADTSAEIRAMLHDLNQRGINLIRDMLARALRDRNIVDEVIKISEENIEHLSLRRLLKALVEPSA